MDGWKSQNVHFSSCEKEPSRSTHVHERMSSSWKDLPLPQPRLGDGRVEVDGMSPHGGVSGSDDLRKKGEGRTRARSASERNASTRADRSV